MVLSLDPLMDATIVRRENGKEYKITQLKGFNVHLERMDGKFGLVLFRSSLVRQLNLDNGSFYVKKTD
jgi:hypothetical protein